jgi:hypothetical protein
VDDPLNSEHGPCSKSLPVSLSEAHSDVRTVHD